MAATQVLTFPKHPARSCIEACSPKTAEVNINPTWLNHRRRRGIGIHGGAIAQRFRVVAVEYLFVKTHPAGVGIEPDREEVMAVLGGRGHPDLAVHHHRIGPSAIR